MDDPIENAIADRFGVFGAFYEPWLRRLHDEVDTAIATNSAIRECVDRKAVVSDAVHAAAETLVWIGVRTLVYELGSSGATSFQSAAARFASPRGREDVLKRYPVLQRLLDGAVDATRVNTLDVIERFTADREQLERAGIRLGRTVTGIDISDGDPHRGGRRVTIIRTEAGSVVHKPRSFEVDLLVARLAEEVSASLRVPLRLPRSIGDANYGWQEFIETRRTQSLDEYHEYYRRLGALLAFFTALGGHDMHYENLVARGADPVPIDLETAVRLRLTDLGDDPLLAAVQRESWFGVGATMILPNYRGNPRFDVDLSAAGTDLEQTSAVMNRARIVGAGTLDIGIDICPAMIVRAAHFPESLSEPPGLDTLSDPLREGYAECAAAIVSQAATLRAILVETPLETREILRPTSTYAAALEASLHPTYLASEADHSRLLGLLATPPTVDDPLAALVAESEQRALARHDIPYFTVDSRTGLLRDDDGDLGAISDTAGHMVAVDVLDAFAVRPRGRDDAAIAGFAAAATDDVWPRDLTPPARPVFAIADGTPAEVAYSIIDDVLDLAIWADDRSACTWITPLLIEQRQLGMSVIDLTFYQGGGVAMLLAAASRAGAHSGSANALEAFLRPHLVAPLQNVDDVSAYTGATSIARVLDRAVPVLDDERVIGHRDALLDRVAARIVHDDSLPLDVVTGIAGVLPVLAEVDRERYGAALSTGVDRLLRGHLDEDGRGLAHGRAGVLAAVAQVSDDERTARRSAEQLVDEARDAVRSADSPEASAWCVGAVGVLLAAAESLAAVGESPTQIEAAIGHEVRILLTPRLLAGSDVSLCHGLGGVISAWTAIADILDDAALRNVLRGTLPNALQRLARDGYRGGVRHGEATLGQMLGMTGFAHALLATDGSVPPPLAIARNTRVAV